MEHQKSKYHCYFLLSFTRRTYIFSFFTLFHTYLVLFSHVIRDRMPWGSLSFTPMACETFTHSCLSSLSFTRLHVVHTNLFSYHFFTHTNRFLFTRHQVSFTNIILDTSRTRWPSLSFKLMARENVHLKTNLHSLVANMSRSLFT